MQQTEPVSILCVDDEPLFLDAFVRLDVENQSIRFEAGGTGAAEEQDRRAAELDDDLRLAPSHALAGAQIEGHVRPPPIFLPREAAIGPGQISPDYSRVLREYSGLNT